MKEKADLVKACCADFYQQAAVKFFLGDSFHPGGLKLTEILAQHLGISETSKILDIACGEGTSAFFMAGRFHAEVIGTDASEKAIRAAQEKESGNSNGNRVNFLKADSDSLPFPDNSFDDVITECSFSTFFEKERTARGVYRVLKPGGKWGLSDMLVDHERLPEMMKNLLFQAGCIGQAENFQGYARRMQDAGLQIIEQQDVSWALEEMILEVYRRLNAARLFVNNGKLAVSSEELDTVEGLIYKGKELLQQKVIGYGIVIGQKPA